MIESVRVVGQEVVGAPLSLLSEKDQAVTLPNALCEKKRSLHHERPHHGQTEYFLLDDRVDGKYNN